MENAGINFNTHNLSDDFVNDMFHQYVERHITVDNQEKVSVCSFETCGECNMAYSDSCYTCKFAEESFQKMLDGMYKKTDPRTKAQVFCICCGARTRSPLRRWKNVYICSDCWKIKEQMGDERFEKALKGEET